MKTLHALLSAIVLFYLVKDGTCGAVDLKEDIKTEDQAVLKAKDGLFDKLFNTLISGYETATKILQDLLEKGDDKGFLANLYEKLKEELKKLKEYILGGSPAIGDEVDEARRAVEKLIEEHKRIQANSKIILEGAVESVKNAKIAEKIVKEGPDVVRHRIFEIERALEDHVFDGMRRPIDLARNDVNIAADTFKSSVEFLQKQGIKLTDEEKNLLDGITKRVRDSLIHAKDKLREH